MIIIALPISIKLNSARQTCFLPVTTAEAITNACDPLSVSQLPRSWRSFFFQLVAVSICICHCFWPLSAFIYLILLRSFLGSFAFFDYSSFEYLPSFWRESTIIIIIAITIYFFSRTSSPKSMQFWSCGFNNV
jgi:hypothetical protein